MTTAALTYIGKKNPRPSEFPDMTSLRHDLVESMLFGTLENEGIDYIASIDCIRYNGVYTAASMAYDFDVGRNLWLNKQRWTRLCREYLDLGETTRFLQRCEAIGLGEGKRGVITNLRGAYVPHAAKRHRWGPCLIGYTYRGLRTEQPVFTMHSRVSYVAYIGALDLALAHVLARYIAKRIRVPVEEFQFRWCLDSAQLHAFKSLPMLYSDGWMPYFESSEMRAKYPAIKLISRWHDQIVDSTDNNQPLEEIKYGPLRRVTRRYREFIAGDYLPSVPVSSLNLSPLTRR